MSKYYNRKVANEEPKFKVGYWVMVNTKNIKTKRPKKKLVYKLCAKFTQSSISAFWNLTTPIPFQEGVHLLLHLWILRKRNGLSKG